MKKRITYNTNTNVPEIVNEKCNAAFEQIRTETKAAPRKIYHRKKAAFAAIAVAAAVACAVPVAADYFRGGFEVVSTEFYTKDPARKVNIQQYAENVEVKENQQIGDMTVQSVYSDGESLAIALSFASDNEDLKRATAIYSEMKILLNGKRIYHIGDEESSHTVVWFSKADDGNFYATVNFPEEAVSEASKLEIKGENLKAYNGNLMTWVPNDPDDYYGAGCYEPEMIGVYDDDVFEFEAEFTPDKSNNTLYEINETQGSCTLESILVTPFKTEIKIDGLGEWSWIKVTDNNNNELEGMPNGSTDSFTFGSPLKTANQLIIEVYPHSEGEVAPDCTFTVDIEKGFAEPYTVEFDDSDVVYVPSMEEMGIK